MRMMKRFPLVIAALIASALALSPALAIAKIVELGHTSTQITAPSCAKNVPPSQCLIVLPRTTAIQTASDGVSYPTTVKSDGWIVAFTLGISRLSSNTKTEKNLVHGLDQTFGGPPQLAITVLKPGPKHRFTVAAQSPAFHLIPFLGQVLQEPLSLPPSFTQFTALPVKAGDVIGVTVPTWAPILAVNLNPSKFAYRQSRMGNCKSYAAGETAQLTVGASTRYLCNYTGARVEYTATEVVSRRYPKKYVHSPRRP
jgi:hypothetical protein